MRLKLARNCKSQQGFTLLEIMLVVMLMAVISAGVVMTLPSDSGYRALKDEAQRFSAILQTANDEALMSGHELGIVIDKQSYEFVVYEFKSKKWIPVPTPNFKTKMELEQIELVLSLSGFAWDKREEEENPFEEEDSFSEQDDEEKQIIPQIFVMSSGEVTPFKLRFSSLDKDNKAWIEVDVKVTGELKLLSEEKE